MPIIIGGSNNSILTTTWANKPASYPVGQSLFISNVGAKGSHWWYDGTRYKPVNGSVVLATLDATTSNINNTATVVLQTLLPAGAWQTSDVIRVQAYMEKSGATDTGIATAYVGTAGTTSDTGVLSSTWMTATIRTADSFCDFRLESATSVQQVSLLAGYGNTTLVTNAATTITSAAANALYVSIGIRSGGTTDTVLSRHATITLISKAN